MFCFGTILFAVTLSENCLAEKNFSFLTVFLETVIRNLFASIIEEFITITIITIEFQLFYKVVFCTILTNRFLGCIVKWVI